VCIAIYNALGKTPEEPMTRSITLILSAVALLLVGCDGMPWNKDKKEKMADEGEKKVAVANVMPAAAAATQPSWGKPTGTVTFTQMGEKVHVTGEITGLPPGKHGFHIHEKGDLSAPDLMSTGAHYNPDKHIHGGPTTSPVHAGDLGNLTADTSGKATIDVTVDDITIGGAKNDILGKAVIIHAKEDDLKSQPAGNAGARIAGGVIEMKK
jgi:Cu-Zn family superoxide dismutase